MGLAVMTKSPRFAAGSVGRSVGRPIALAMLFAATLALSGCKTAKEKAEDYYQSGLTLLAAGDEDRAMLQFRNVFLYDGFHKDARKTYADVLMKEGKVQEAYSQYLRLIEQYPDTADVRQILAEISIRNGNWDEAERHGREAIRLAPTVPGVQAIKLALDYRIAVLAKDEATRTKISDQAQALLVTLPTSDVARRIVIDRLVSGPNPTDALPVVEDALKQDPNSLEYHMLKFQLLARSNDAKGSKTQAVGDELKTMFKLFPDNTEVKNSLIGWYMSQKDYDGAEAFLRQLAGDAKGPTDAHLALIQFLQVARGPDAARAELAALIAANAGAPNADLYGALLASFDFQAGKTTEAIAAMEAIVKTATPSDQTRRIKTTLAQMLDSTGDRVGARALVEQVLADDPANVEALKQRATWLIADDKAGDAIVALRAALDQSPRDPQILTLMAAAYERDGSLDLAGQQLARAVEISGSAPADALRYAQFLIRQNKPTVAETVLINARQVNPTSPDVLQALVQLYARQAKWPQAQDSLDALKALNLPDAQTHIPELQAALLAGQNKLDDSLALLQAQAAKGDQADANVVMVVQTQIRAGKLPEARTYLDDALAKMPKDLTLRLLSASLDAQMGKADAAETAYRALIAEAPQAELPVRLLYTQLAAQGHGADATKVLDAGLAAQPKSPTLRWMKAGELERDGQIDAAIAIYEGLYADDSSNTVVANNLASMITTYHDDDASLARAEVIARRLRGLDVPAFQDTYGWIALRRGNLDEAKAHLEPAAKAMPKEALTQYHLAMLYDKMGRNADAIAAFELALSLAGQTPPPQMAAQMTVAKTELDRLKTAPAQTPALAPAPAPAPAPTNPAPAPAQSGTSP